MPSSSARSRIEVPAYPCSANSARAASRMRARVSTADDPRMRATFASLPTVRLASPREVAPHVLTCPVVLPPPLRRRRPLAGRRDRTRSLVAAAGNKYNDSFTLPGTESTRALNLLKASFPTQSGDTAQIVLRAGDVKDAGVQARVTAMLEKVAKLPHVVEVKSPYEKGKASQISKDGTIAFADVNLDKLPQDIPKSAYTKLIDSAQSIDGDDLEV